LPRPSSGSAWILIPLLKTRFSCSPMVRLPRGGSLLSFLLICPVWPDATCIPPLKLSHLVGRSVAARADPTSFSDSLYVLMVLLNGVIQQLDVALSLLPAGDVATLLDEYPLPTVLTSLPVLSPPVIDIIAVDSAQLNVLPQPISLPVDVALRRSVRVAALTDPTPADLAVPSVLHSPAAVPPRRSSRLTYDRLGSYLQPDGSFIQSLQPVTRPFGESYTIVS
jgi:hypothetical protein